MNSSASTTRAANGCSGSANAPEQDAALPAELPEFFREARQRRATVGWLVGVLVALAAVAAAEACALARLGEPVGRYWVPGIHDPMEVRP